MKQQQFEKQHQPDWQLLHELLQNKKHARQPQFPQLFRRVCQHLALARSRMYSPPLIEHLNQLTLEAHQHLYNEATHSQGRLQKFFLADFPRAVRSEWRLLLLSAIVFYGPLLSLLIAIQFNPDLVYSLFDPSQVDSFESMYQPGNERMGVERESETDLYMFGYYIWNNTSIGFRTFASGLLLGIGTLITLVFNGLTVGGVAGHLTHIGYSDTFWPFVVGHSAFELTAIVLSGVAGFKLGLAVLSPHRRSRFEAVRKAASDSVPIIGGAAIMFVMAAFIEAFWSSTTWPPSTVKYVVASILWLLVIAYFSFMGRTRAT